MQKLNESNLIMVYNGNSTDFGNEFYRYKLVEG